MKLILAVLVMVLVIDDQAQGFLGEAIGGAKDMWRAYKDLEESNWIGADKYFHARGNYEAAKRGPGGKFAAEIISEAREAFQILSSSGNSKADSEADQRANRWGRNGGDPNHYRPKNLPDKY
ncbi:serum amyloid A-5 protein-like [Pseudorasbora parva]|uniref:serum amyloid A-5 protein-like n=1 Tax=Pseudorasbora parva TaxID=51549 RepID=UPI00351F3129